MSTTTLRLPAGHARDWFSRCADGSDDYTAREVATTPRTVTLELDDKALADLISDALYYAAEMDATNTGDKDYRPMARTLLKALDKRGVRYERKNPRTFAVTIIELPEVS